MEKVTKKTMCLHMCDGKRVLNWRLKRYEAHNPYKSLQKLFFNFEVTKQTYVLNWKYFASYK